MNFIPNTKNFLILNHLTLFMLNINCNMIVSNHFILISYQTNNNNYIKIKCFKDINKKFLKSLVFSLDL